MVRVAASVGLSISITGCLLIPHVQQEAPALSGVVRRETQPIANARVTFDVNQPPCSSDVKTTTDATGHFTFERRTYFTPVFVFGDRRDSWDVCIEEGGERSVWTTSDWWGGPKGQVVECDLHTPTREGACSITRTVPW